MIKTKSLDQLAKVSGRLQQKGKTVGLITGCFDIVHLGHLELFRLAKQKCDCVIVGLDSDESIRKTKGNNRPINNIRRRADFLEAIIYVDYVFEIESTTDRIANLHRGLYDTITSTLSPNFLITNAQADLYWREKQTRAAKFDAKLVLLKSKRLDATTSIIDKLGKKF